MISTQDDIFIYQTQDRFIPAERKAYYGNPYPLSNPLEGLHNYIKGYKFAVNKIYESFEQAGKESNIEVQDTIIFPLVFCHRHIVELELKYLASSFCSSSQDTKQVLQQNHDLIKIWNHIFPHIRKRANRIGFTVKFDAILHYLQEFDKFDNGSFNYRYSLKKEDLSPTINNIILLDVPNMHTRLNNFHEYIMGIIYHLKSQLDDLEYDKSFAKQFKSDLQSHLTEIEEVLNHKHYDEHKKAYKNNGTLSQIRNCDPDEDSELRYCASIPKDVLRILLILQFSKMYIENNHLAIDKEEHRKDIFRSLQAESQNVRVNDFDLIYINSKIRQIFEHVAWYKNIIEEILNKK